MDKPLVKALLRVAQSGEERFASSKTLDAFVAEFNIGWRKGASLVFDGVSKARVRELLEAEGVDPATAPDAWQGLTRAESLTLGRNEKWTNAPAKRDRVAIKALPGRPLLLGSQALFLPPGCHLDVEGTAITPSVQHESILVVENWECFNRIDAVTLDFSRAGANPLVVWRGDRSDNATGASMRFMRGLNRPVWVFADFDPAGLLIAAGMPNLAGVLAPEEDSLAAMLENGLEDRYRLQLPSSEAALDRCRHQDIVTLWRLIRRAGRALPQEALLQSRRTNLRFDDV